MKQVLRFFSVWMAIVLSFGNAVVGFTPVAVAKVHVSASTPTGTIAPTSEWIQTKYHICYILWPKFYFRYFTTDRVKRVPTPTLPMSDTE